MLTLYFSCFSLHAHTLFLRGIRWTEIAASNEQKALFKRLVTPIAFGGLLLISHFLSVILGIIGVAKISVWLGYVTWICWLTVAFWAFSNATHYCESAAKEIDKVAMMMYEVGLDVFAMYASRHMVQMAKKKD
jgi:hypothetical protein